MTNTARDAFIAWLNECCTAVAKLEQEAQTLLQEEKDTQKYRNIMREKALLLETLPGEAEKFLAAMPEHIAAEASASLEQFAAGASRALSLGSVFYMSALLYPDNHQKGQPNNLEIFAAEMTDRTWD